MLIFWLILLTILHTNQIFSFVVVVVVAAQVKMPNGNIDIPIVEDNFDGTVRIQYNPKEDGVHEMILLKDGAPVQGKYFLYVYNFHFWNVPFKRELFQKYRFSFFFSTNA